MKRKFKKGLGVTISAALLMAMTPIVNAPQYVSAADTNAEVKNVNLGVLGLENPGQPDDQNDSWANGSGCYIYFGAYPQSDKTGATYEPICWRVLDNANDSDSDGTDDCVLLLSNNILDVQQFNADSSKGNVWADSDLKKWMNSETGWTGIGSKDGFLNTAFDSAEQSAICETYVDESGDYRGTKECDLNGEKIFALSLREAQKSEYGFFLTPTGNEQLYYNKTTLSTKTAYVLGKNSQHGLNWLRSAITTTNNTVSMIDGPGDYDNYYVDYIEMGVAPALNLDYEAVVLTTASGTAKGDFAIVEAANNVNKWNVTILDGTDFEASRKPAELGSIQPGAKVTINVTNIPTLTSGNEYTQISALIVDENNTVIAYGKISDEVKTGELEVTIPTGFEEGEYTLKVFAEDVNSSATENNTDYASNMVDITLTIAEIEDVEIKDIVIPEAGEKFDTAATCENVGIVETEPVVTYTKDGSTVTGTADYDTEYVLAVTLKAKEGYKFTDNTTATVNGKKAESVILNADGSLTVTYKFVTEEEVTTTEEEITTTEEVTTEEATTTEEVTTEVVTNEGTTDEATTEVVTTEASTTEEKVTDAPKTGDRTPVVFLFATLLVSFSGVILAKRTDWDNDK